MFQFNSVKLTHLNRNTLRLSSNCVPKHCGGDICFTAVLESVSLDKFIPESPSTSEPGDMSPCRSPSTPRHLRYRQTGGTSPTDTLTTHDRDVLFSSREVSTLLFHCPGIVALAGDNSRTTMSPASAFAIATAAAGHGSSQGRQSEPGWGIVGL